MERHDAIRDYLSLIAALDAVTRMLARCGAGAATARGFELELEFKEPTGTTATWRGMRASCCRPTSKTARSLHSRPTAPVTGTPGRELPLQTFTFTDGTLSLTKIARLSATAGCHRRRAAAAFSVAKGRRPRAPRTRPRWRARLGWSDHPAPSRHLERYAGLFSPAGVEDAALASRLLELPPGEAARANGPGGASLSRLT